MGFDGKSKFLIKRKPKGDLPIVEKSGQITSEGEVYDLNSTRYKVAPKKERANTIVGFCSVSCERCGNSREISFNPEHM